MEGFAALMNDKAHRLGLDNTHFVNPNGLDAPDHYATARDLATLAAYAMENPIFAKTVSTKTVTVGSRTLRNHNKLLWMLEGADGVKTGFTKAAGRILVSSCFRHGRRLIAVTINDGNDWNDHRQLMETGFENYTVKQVVRSGMCVGTVDILSGDSEKVELLADSDFNYALSGDERIELVLPEPEFVYAPVAQGQCAGYAHVYLEGKNVGRIPLVYGQTVEMETLEEESFWSKLFKGDKK